MSEETFNPWFDQELLPDLTFRGFAEAAQRTFRVIRGTENPQETLAVYGMRGEKWTELMDEFMSRIVQDQSIMLDADPEMVNIYDRLEGDEEEAMMCVLTWMATLSICLGYELRKGVAK